MGNGGEMKEVRGVGRESWMRAAWEGWMLSIGFWAGLLGREELREGELPDRIAAMTLFNMIFFL